jgi:hypothetical protein
MAAKALIGRKVERAMTINEGGAPSSQLSHHCGPPQSLFAFCEKERSAQAFGKDSRDRSYIPQMLRLAGWKEEKCDWGSHNCRGYGGPRDLVLTAALGEATLSEAK